MPENKQLFPEIDDGTISEEEVKGWIGKRITRAERNHDGGIALEIDQSVRICIFPRLIRVYLEDTDVYSWVVFD